MDKFKWRWSNSWHFTYFVLAIFNLVTILILLNLSQENLQKYKQALAYTDLSVDILNQLGKVSLYAQEVNAPGNNVFSSKNPDLERSQLVQSSIHFDQALEVLKSLEQKAVLSFENLKSTHVQEQQKIKLQSIATSKNEMEGLSLNIFDQFSEGRIENASALMAEMDRIYADLNREIEQYRVFENDLIQKALIEHRRKLDQAQETKVLLGCLLLITVLGMTGFGVYLHKFVKKTLQSARRNEAVLATLSNAAIVAFTDRKGIITEVNDKFCEISGYSREELIGKDHRLVNSGTHSKQFFRDLWKRILAGEVWSGVIQNRKKTGEPYFVRTAISAVRGDNGEVKEFMAIRFDVTDQMILESDLIRAQETAKIGSWKLNLETNHLSWSSEHYRIFEVNENETQEDLLRIYRSRIHPEDRAEMDQILIRIREKGEDFIFNHRVYLDHGSRIKHVRGIGKVQKDSSGRPTSVSGTCQDLTDLVNLEEQNRFILKAMGIGIWQYNPSNQSLYWDQSMYDLYGLNPKEFNGHYQAWETSLSPANKQSAVNELKLALSGEKEFNTTFEILLPNGGLKHIGGKGVVVRNDKGEPTVMYGINWDRSKEVQAEESLLFERSKSAHNSKLASLGEMSAGIAHEINNPLAVISGTVQLLRKFRNDEVKFDSKLETLSKSVARIEKIVKGLKKFSRSTQTDLKQESVIGIVNEALVITEAKAKRGLSVIETEIEPNLFINCDQVEIEQVLVNLINNAIDAIQTFEERWVRVKAFEREQKVVIQITDSGSGIPPEIEAKLFQPFFTTKKIGEGTGLGLSIVKGILDSHKATIQINRSFKNTCFEIEFPKPVEIEIQKAI